MKKAINITLLSLILFVSGCAASASLLNKVAPNQVDSSGKEIPGTHTAIPIAQDTAGAIPYGSLALNGLLLVVNFIQKVQNDKIGRGLKSTVQAIEQAGKDPSIAEAVSKLKVDLSNAHDIANVKPLINDILAKV